MIVKRIVARLLIAALTFFINVIATKKSVAAYMSTFPPSIERAIEAYPPNQHRRFINAYRTGKQEAEADLKQNKLKLKVTGMPNEDEQNLFARIYQKYRIELDRISDCKITADIEGYGWGYNGVMRAFIEQQYGEGFIDKLFSESH